MRSLSRGRGLALLALFFALCLVLFAACGEQPARSGGDDGDGQGDVSEEPSDDGGDGEAADDAEDAEDEDEDAEDEDDEVAPMGDTAGLSFDTADPEVGQWITYGVDDEAGEATISIVGAETVDGEDCLWYQFEIPGEVEFKLLASFEQLEVAIDAMEEMWVEFSVDPEEYVREMIAESGGDFATGMMSSEEVLASGMEFLRGLKMVVVKENGVLTGYDISGVADVLAPVMEDPESFGSMTGMTGFQMGGAGAAPGVDTDEILETLDQIDFDVETTAWQVGGESVDGLRWQMVYEPEDVLFELVLSNDLPIIPLAYARGVANGEEHWLEARDFGWSGAVDRLPGSPGNVVDVAQMLEGFVQMSQQSMGAMQGPPQ